MNNNKDLINGISLGILSIFIFLISFLLIVGGLIFNINIFDISTNFLSTNMKLVYALLSTLIIDLNLRIISGNRNKTIKLNTYQFILTTIFFYLFIYILKYIL